MRIGEAATDSEYVHDRKNPRPLKPLHADGLRIGKQSANIRMPISEAGGRARPDDRVEVAGREHTGDGLAFGRVFEPHIGWQPERYFLDPSGILVSAAHPSDIRRGYAMIFL